MKKFLLVLFMTVFGMSMAYADLTPAQKALQNEIMAFLREEGYAPDIDSDGDIYFKKEGAKYYVIINERDTSPMYLTLSRIFSYDDKYSKENLTLAQNEINLYKGIKVLLMKSSYRIQAELYLTNSDTFKYAFYKLTSQISDAIDELIDEVNKVVSNGGGGYGGGSNVVSNKIPFVIDGFSVANVDYDDNIITDYGYTIYSSSTKYLKPKITVKSTVTGSYKVYVRLYKDNSMSTGSSSPAGYTYDTTLDIDSSTKTFKLSGWGGNTSGHWSSGSYRFEIWYNDYCIGQKSFTVY